MTKWTKEAGSEKEATEERKLDWQASERDAETRILNFTVSWQI